MRTPIPPIFFAAVVGSVAAVALRPVVVSASPVILRAVWLLGIVVLIARFSACFRQTALRARAVVEPAQANAVLLAFPFI